MRRRPLSRLSQGRDMLSRSHRRPCGPRWRGRGGILRGGVFRFCLRYICWVCGDVGPSVCASSFQHPYAEGYAPRTRRWGATCREGGRGGEAANPTVLRRARTWTRWIWMGTRRCRRFRADFGWARPRLFRRCCRRHCYPPRPLRIPLRIPPYRRPLHPPPPKPTPLFPRDSLSSSSHVHSHASSQDTRSWRTRRPVRRRFFVHHAQGIGAIARALKRGCRWGKEVWMCGCFGGVPFEWR
jgi:hypothetical protein